MSIANNVLVFEEPTKWKPESQNIEGQETFARFQMNVVDADIALNATQENSSSLHPEDRVIALSKNLTVQQGLINSVLPLLANFKPLVS